MNNKWGLLTSIAIGDAAGANFEFKPKEVLQKFTSKSYPNGTGIYTDDTQMSIGVAWHTFGGYDITTEEYARHFYDQYQLDRTRPGFSRRTKLALDEKDVDGFITSCASQIPRDTNGCVMRVLPIGYYKDVERVKQAAMIQCVVTHPYLDCIIASQFTALMAHYFLYRSTEMNLDQFLMEHLGIENFKHVRYSWDKSMEVPCNALKTASFCFNNTNFTSANTILHRAIQVGGDVDSTAAISLGLAFLNKNVENDIPDALFDNLENGEFGRDFLGSLDCKLETLSN